MRYRSQDASSPTDPTLQLGTPLFPIYCLTKYSQNYPANCFTYPNYTSIVPHASTLNIDTETEVCKLYIVKSLVTGLIQMMGLIFVRNGGLQGHRWAWLVAVISNQGCVFWVPERRGMTSCYSSNHRSSSCLGRLTNVSPGFTHLRYVEEWKAFCTLKDNKRALVP